MFQVGTVHTVVRGCTDLLALGLLAWHFVWILFVTPKKFNLSTKRPYSRTLQRQRSKKVKGQIECSCISKDLVTCSDLLGSLMGFGMCTFVLLISVRDIVR